MGIFKKVFGKKEVKSDDDLKAAVFKKANAHLDAEAKQPVIQNKDEQGKSYKGNDQLQRKNIKTVLLEIANRGDAGVLAMSISDTTGLSRLETSKALSGLSKENYIDSVNSAAGLKYYLTEQGKKFCISKEFNTEYE